MNEYDWELSSGAPLCELSDAFYRAVRDSIFRQLTPETSHEQFAAAVEHLLTLRDELKQAIRPMHYGSLVGGHRCIDQLFIEARARLRSLEIMQPIPFTLSPPPSWETPAHVVRDLRDAIQPNQEATTLGTDDPTNGDRHPQ
jgi:hypothetical protein